MKKNRGRMPLPQDSRREASGETPMHYRALSLRLDAGGRGPATLDEKTRSVEVVGATEEPVEVFDWQRFEVIREVLLMDGLEMPKSRQVPLLDSHSRYSTAAVMGSYREMVARDGQLTGRVFFSSVPEAENPYTKLREGHLTDFSIGYRPIESTWIDEGQTAMIRGRSFKGPLRVTERSRIKELSITPIGADELAKVRSEHQPTPPAAHAPAKENDDMNERLKKRLVSRGLPETASEDEAWAYMEKLEIKRASEIPPPAPAPAVTAPNIDAERNSAAVAERSRIAEIDGAARAFNFPEDLQRKLVEDGTPTATALRSVMDWAIANKATAGGVGHRGAITHGADERDKFRAAAIDSILLRSGDSGAKVRPEKPAPGASDLMGHSLRELARHSLVIAGQPAGGHAMEMVGRALMTTDFPNILAAGANKSLLAGWESAEESWKEWCSIGDPVSDFKAQSLVRASETSDLDEVPEHGEFTYGKMGDSKETVQIATYGKLFAITRQAIINDDLGALLSVPAKMGEAAARKVGDLPYAVLTANSAMGDGVALFHANHANLIAHGSGAVPGITTIAAGILAMGIQKDILGKRRLNIRPQYLIAPKALEGVGEIFFRSNQFSDHSTVATDSTFASLRVNPYAGTYFTRVYDARLDDSDAAAWYLAARKGMTVAVFFLNGVQVPYMETRQGWSVDGTEYKVRIDAAAKALDWRGLFNNNGN
jgi:phage major head subunit gpT-like protein